MIHNTCYFFQKKSENVFAGFLVLVGVVFCLFVFVWGFFWVCFFVCFCIESIHIKHACHFLRQAQTDFKFFSLFFFVFSLKKSKLKICSTFSCSFAAGYKVKNESKN